jgi:hypothetical protein
VVLSEPLLAPCQDPAPSTITELLESLPPPSSEPCAAWKSMFTFEIPPVCPFYSSLPVSVVQLGAFLPALVLPSKALRSPRVLSSEV